jgi:hypothetical protein
MLSPRERRQLREIEKSLELDAPDLAARLRETPAQPLARPRYRLAAATALAGALVALFGLLLFSPLLMLGGACLALSGYLRLHLMRWSGDERP